jgi:hypothetical protein
MSGILTTRTLIQTGQYQCMNLEWGTYATYYYGSNDGSTELLQSLLWGTQQTRLTKNSKAGPPTIVEK